MKEVDYLLFYDRTIKKFTFKFFSSKLYIRLYNRLSKEIKDFKDL